MAVIVQHTVQLRNWMKATSEGNTALLFTAAHHCTCIAHTGEAKGKADASRTHLDCVVYAGGEHLVPSIRDAYTQDLKLVF